MSLYYGKILALTLLMALPFYFFNNFLQQKIRPRQNGKKLLLYFAVVLATSFIYITVFVFAVVQIAKIFM
jgi:hypothetical protein